MATFITLTSPSGMPVWVNLDRVQCMSRLPAWDGEDARPERTRLWFVTDEVYVEALETPDEIVAGGAS
jgi:hypothetical protein